MVHRLAVLALPVALLALPGTAGAAADHSLSGTYPLQEAPAVSLQLPVGEIHVESGTAPEVRVDLTVNCDHWDRSCADRAAAVHLESERNADHLQVRVAGLPKSNQRGLHVDGTITVPADRPLAIDMGVGELHVAGITANLKVSLGVGEVKITLPEAAVQRVRLAAGVGETTLRAANHHLEGDRNYLVGSRLAWNEGAGRSQVAVDVGVGEIDARLE